HALSELETAAREGSGNLLDLSVKAARVYATVGEISLALENVYGRHKADIRSISGVYRQEMGDHNAQVDTVQRSIAAFEQREGRRPRILIAKMGQDGHDRGQKVI